MPFSDKAPKENRALIDPHQIFRRWCEWPRELQEEKGKEEMKENKSKHQNNTAFHARTPFQFYVDYAGNSR